MRPQVFKGSEAYPSPSPGPVLTIGNFDGVHRGHRHLLDRVVACARRVGGPVCVYTFDPPPRAVLEPDRHPPRITDLEQRIELMGEAGVDQVVIECFDRSFAARTSSWFAAQVLAERLAPRAMVVGHDFRFGRGRTAGAANLREHLPDLPVEEVAALVIDGVVASSSQIRERVAEGLLGDAAVLLGRLFSLRGRVVRGDRRGRALGFPTANLDTAAQLLPASGVYAAYARIDGEAEGRPAVINLGVRPTFRGRRFLIEAHLLDFTGDLYGRLLSIDFVEFLRPERRFEGPDALVAQIGVDVARARAIFDS